MIEGAVERYEGLGTNLFKVSAFMGECELLVIFFNPFRVVAIFICPTYLLLRAFDGCGYKVGVPLIVIVLFFKFFF